MSVHALSVTNTSELADCLYADMRIGVRGTHFVVRAVAYTPRMALFRLNWKYVPKARTRKDEQVVDQYLHPLGTTSQAGTSPKAGR